MRNSSRETAIYLGAIPSLSFFGNEVARVYAIWINDRISYIGGVTCDQFEPIGEIREEEWET